MKTTKEKIKLVKSVHEKICRYFDVNRLASLAMDRRSKYKYPRQLTHYFICESLKNMIELRIIANHTGVKSHGTVLFSHKMIKNLIDTELKTRKHIEYLRKKLNVITEFKETYDYMSNYII